MDSLKEEFDHQLAGIAWSLWKELGVAGTDRFHENCLISLEELVILTILTSEYDPRLRDEALDWSSRYHECFSLSRLRTFLKELDSDAMHSFSQFAAALNSVSSAKWPNAAEITQFKARLSKKSALRSLESPSLLLLRLRNLFGPGAKADILSHLLTKSDMQFSAADLVQIGYSKRSLMTALDHLAASGILTITNVRNKKNYQLKNSKELQVAIGKLPKVAPPWRSILQVLIAIRSVIPEIQNSSEITKGVILRNCLIQIEPLLPTFISPILSMTPDFNRAWKAVMELLNAFRQGNFFMEFEVYDAFDKVVVDLLRELYPLDDCIDGIETIENEISSKINRHTAVYKESYQLFLSFISDLEVQLKQFLEFPFHKAMNEPLADIAYKFSKEKLPLLLEKMRQLNPTDQITNAQLANRQYQMVMPELRGLRQFIYTFKKQLEELHFVNTDVHLLSLSANLHKRHLVLDLYRMEKT